jgi:hypothetical protein
MDSSIKVSLRDVYGVTKAYPANEQAHCLAAMVGTKTLTAETLRHAKGMGFTLSYVDYFTGREFVVAANAPSLPGQLARLS